MKKLLIFLIFIQILFASESVMSFELNSGKIANLYIKDDILYYSLKNGTKTEFTFPKYINKASRFYLNITKDRLHFSNKGVKYTIYQDLKDYKISKIGIKVDIHGTVYDLQGKVATLKGDLREFDKLGVMNVEDKKERLKYYKEKVYYEPDSSKYKEPRLVFYLWLHDLRLKEFPKGFAKFENLENLDLGLNCLTVLPDFVCKYKYLKRLKLHYNKLTKLPECIGELENLEYLDIKGNAIKTLPESIKKLKYLKTIKRDKRYAK